MQNKKKRNKQKKINRLKNIEPKKLLLPGLILLGVIGISLSIYFVNKKHRQLEIYTEITFMTPTEALVFWKSENDTLGYIKYGDSKYGKKEIALQTSSTPGTVHVVFLENIPLEGIYIQKINEDDNFLIIPKTEHLKYDSNLYSDD